VKGRAARRGIVLVLSLMFCAVRYFVVWIVARLRGRRVTAQQRAEWMHFCGLRVLSAMGIRYRVKGVIPSGATLIVANHLSYLDIVIFSAAVPCAFVAKEEIAGWPGFGLLARLGGTIFLDRESRLSAWDAAESMALRLAENVPVLIFPEGTSTDGREVLRFHSTLFEAAVESGLAVVPAAVFYQPVGAGLEERDICWFGDDLFLPHLKQVLGLTDFMAVVRFGAAEVFPDRRAAAWRSHDAVVRLRGTCDVEVVK
jgi:1-acyl-sn-glycerol-3-phosphate acyltransferase